MNKILEMNEILSMNIDDNFERVESFNKENCITNNTKLIIVGTITPPGGRGYFYTAPRNRIYGYLDEYFGTKENGLKKLKSKLEGDTREGAIEQIKQYLVEREIAFLDVMKYAIRKKGSCADKDIAYFSLDKESFGKINNAVIICNSRLAEICYCEICEQLGLKNKHVFLSQRRATKEQWLQTLKEINL